jgi:hypothetical protein
MVIMENMLKSERLLGEIIAIVRYSGMAFPGLSSGGSGQQQNQSTGFSSDEWSKPPELGCF